MTIPFEYEAKFTTKHRYVDLVSRWQSIPHVGLLVTINDIPAIVAEIGPENEAGIPAWFDADAIAYHSYTYKITTDPPSRPLSREEGRALNTVTLGRTGSAVVYEPFFKKIVRHPANMRRKKRDVYSFKSETLIWGEVSRMRTQIIRTN